MTGASDPGAGADRAVRSSQTVVGKIVFVKAAARVNNRAKNSHQPTRRRERQMCGFRDARRTQAFLSCFGPIRQHFALPRHQMNAACHRTILRTLNKMINWVC